MAETQPGDDESNACRVERRRQTVLAAALTAGLAVMAWRWIDRRSGEALWVDRDQLPPRQATFVIDPNQAPWPEWTVLPEVGETLARRIVEHRDAHGPFRCVDDLRRVKGIGPKTLDKLRPYLGSFDAPEEAQKR